MNIPELLIGGVIGFFLGTTWMILRRARGIGPSPSLIRDLAKEDTGNPIEDADRRMVYGAYEDAAALVESAILSEPGRTDLKAKLLEVLFVWGETERFLASVEQYDSELRKTPHWTKVRVMGEQLCPDEQLFRQAS